VVFVNTTPDEPRNKPSSNERGERKTNNPCEPASIETYPIECGILLKLDVVHALKSVQDSGPDNGSRERKKGFKDDRKPDINLVLVVMVLTSVLAGPKESFQIVTQIAVAATRAQNACTKCFTPGLLGA